MQRNNTSDSGIHLTTREESAQVGDGCRFQPRLLQRLRTRRFVDGILQRVQWADKGLHWVPVKYLQVKFIPKRQSHPKWNDGMMRKQTECRRRCSTRQAA